MTVADKLFLKVDNSPLVVFRIVFGILLAAEAWGAILTGWVHRAFIEPQITFPFIDFDFLQPLPGNGMIYYYIIMGFMGCLVALGFRYRIAMFSYAILWAGVYFMQKTHYNNHYYLLMVFNFLMCFVNAADYASLDAKYNPHKLKNYCPQWNIWLFKGMILIVYFYASVAKMYPEWIEAKPIQIWFENKSDYWLIGPLLLKPWFQYFVAWMGIVFDLLIGPALLWRKTRKVAFIASIFFHLFNSIVFQVGIFPYLGISFALFFFDSKTIQSIFLKSKNHFSSNEVLSVSTIKKYILSSVLLVFFLFNVLTPLRHHLFKGNVNWTQEGHRLSWRMMLRVKSGSVKLFIKDNDLHGQKRLNLNDYLTPKQQRKLATHPDFMWQFIQILKQEYNYPSKNISIYANGLVSLNGGMLKPLYDPDFDLTEAKWERFNEADWILRYDEKE